MTQLVTTVYNITNRLVHEYGLGDLLFNVEEVTGSTISDKRLVSVNVSPDRYSGAYVRITNIDANINESRQVQSYDPLAGTLSIYPPFEYNYVGGMPVQIWKYYDPSNILYEIETAMKTIPLKKYIPMTSYDITEFRVHFDKDKPLIIALELSSDYDPLVGNISITIDMSQPITLPAYDIVEEQNLYAVICRYDYKPDFTGLHRVTVTNNTNGFIDDIHILKPYTNSLYLTAVSRVFPADVHGIYELTDYFDNKVADGIYMLNKIDWKYRKKLDGWYMPDEKTLILPKNIEYPIYAYVTQPYSEGQIFSYASGHNVAYEVNENLLLHKTAELIFSRMLTQASITGIDTNWAQAQLVRAQQNAQQELLKENMRVRANTPKTQEIEYILGDTYLGRLW